MSKGLPELSEQYKSGSHENDEQKLHKALAHGKKSKTPQNRCHRNNHKNDPPDSKGEAINSVLGLSSTTIKSNLVAIALASKKDILKLGLSKIKVDILKHILTTKENILSDSISYRNGNDSGALNTSDSIAYTSRIYENLSSSQNIFQRGVDHTNASGDLIESDTLECLVQVHCAFKENDQQDDFH